MVPKRPQRLCQFCLPVSLILTSNLIAQPLKAQVVDPRQILDNSSVQEKQIPSSQDVQPLPSPLPSLELPQPLPPLEELLQSPSQQRNPTPAEAIPENLPGTVEDVQPLPSPELPQPLPPPEELLQPQPTQTPSEALPENVPGTITVEKFEVVGSTVFSPERLAQVLAPFTQKPISFAELFQARSAVTQLYIDEGYITSGAYIPPQKLSGGIIRIQVVEGRLEGIQVNGTRRLNPNYIRSRIAVATSQPLNRNRLLESLQLLQLNPLIQNLSAELSAGSRLGESLLQIEVTEAKSYSMQLVADNGRVPSVGSFRRRVQLNEANFLGQGDGISLAYTNTDGSNALDASYALPINPRNGTLSFSYGTTSSNVIEPPFDRLDINSDSRYYELTLRQPISQTPTEEFTLGLSAARRESETALLDTPFPLALGADEEGRTRISALRFFQEWTQRDSREVIAARSQFSVGIGAFDATINETAPDSRFFAWQGQAQWVRLLARDTLLLLRADVQLADRALVSLEQFSLGGIESIRGYRQDLLLTDNGAFASAEVRLPILRIPRLNGVLQVAPFVDVGTAWNSGRSDPDPNTLASVGLGLRWQQGDRFTARLDWGIPLVSVDSRERTWQENGVYFSVLYNPF